MSCRGNRLRGQATRLVVGLLAPSFLLGACRIRREQPQAQLELQPSAEPSSSAGAMNAPSIVASATSQPAQTRLDEIAQGPVVAPPGVLVVAAIGAASGSSAIQSALYSVRAATNHLLEGGSGVSAAASGLIPFERAIDVPVAFGAPRRRSGAPPQCDVVLLDSTGRPSGVGAVTDLESPARVAIAVHDRSWGLVVGDGAHQLAAEAGIASRVWSPKVEEQPEIEADAASGVPPTRNHDLAVAADEDAPNHAATAKAGSDARHVQSKPARQSIAVLLLRDREGRFAIAAEECGKKGDPSGRLTPIASPGVRLFVGDEGAVFIGGIGEPALESRPAEQIYRRLVALQVPKSAADWGLRNAEGADLVIVVSRTGSAIASNKPAVWARNHSDGESSGQLQHDGDIAGLGQVAAAATEEINGEENRAADTPPHASVDSAKSSVDAGAKGSPIRRFVGTNRPKVATQTGVSSGALDAAGGHSARLSEQDGGQP